MTDLFEEILSALKVEDHVMLATIISTSGSTPASAFSKMLIKNEGIVSVGTVGDGCLEADVLEAAKTSDFFYRRQMKSYYALL